MAQKRARRRFTREYKAQAVQRVIESGRPLADIAAELDVSPGQLSQWRNEQLAAGSAASRNGNIGPPARAKPREEILGRKYLQTLQLSRHGRSWVLRRCRETPADCVETLPEEVRLGPWVG
jgi:transposase-like protein